MTGEHASSLAGLILSLGENADKGNGAEYALAMHEAYLYLSGGTARGGIKAKTDPRAWDEGIVGTYRAPDLDDRCKKNYVVLISNGAPDNGENTTAENLLDRLSGKAPTDPIDLDPSQCQQNWSDEYSRFLAGEGIVTYTIDVLPKPQLQGLANTRLLESMATQGGGKYYAVTYDGGDPAQQLIDALNDILNDIIAIESVYAASALPVSVNVQARDTNLNQVYVGMFRPDPNRRPRWTGNLKLYEIGLVGEKLALVDTKDDPVYDEITTFVRNGVISHWTHPSSYWTFKGGDYPPSDSPDGPAIEKGAAAQMQREFTQLRRFFTCVGCAAGSRLSASPFNTGNGSITANLLGAADSAEWGAIIEWVRGSDNTNPSETGVDGYVRPSVQGDILHSSPALINYGDKIVVFYGSNDGLFRAVRAGTDVASGSGIELWSFVAEEFLPSLKRLRDNTIDVKVPFDNPSAEQAHDENRTFHFDGASAVYYLDADGDDRIRRDIDGAATGDKAYLYLIPRRGGHFIYALDVTDPYDPIFMWKKSSTNSGYGELGQGWSAPMIREVHGVANPVLILGAGYDPQAEDSLPAGTADEGRGVLVLDAFDGTLIWQAGPRAVNASNYVTAADMIYPLASDISVADINGDRKVDVGYVGDTAGQVWRINFSGPGDGPGSWTIHKFADLRNSVPSTDRRKFLFPPDIVRFHTACNADAATAGELAILIGSGDREHPLDMSVYNDLFGTNLAETPNRFYMLRDRNPVSSVVTPLTEADLTDVTATDSVPPTANGWFFRLDAGEKVVSNALTLGGIVYFATSLPPPPDLAAAESCSPLGDARIYKIQYCNGAPIGDPPDDTVIAEQRYEEIKNGGLLPPLVPAVLKNLRGADKIYLAVIAGLKVIDAGIGLDTGNKKTFWYTEKGD